MGEMWFHRLCQLVPAYVLRDVISNVASQGCHLYFSL